MWRPWHASLERSHLTILRHQTLATTTATNPLHMSNNVVHGGQGDKNRAEGDGEGEVEGRHRTSKTSLRLRLQPLSHHLTMLWMLESLLQCGDIHLLLRHLWVRALVQSCRLQQLPISGGQHLLQMIWEKVLLTRSPSQSTCIKVHIIWHQVEVRKAHRLPSSLYHRLSLLSPTFSPTLSLRLILILSYLPLNLSGGITRFGKKEEGIIIRPSSSKIRINIVFSICRCILFISLSFFCIFPKYLLHMNVNYRTFLLSLFTDCMISITCMKLEVWVVYMWRL